jgi:hypothetical protein
MKSYKCAVCGVPNEYSDEIVTAIDFEHDADFAFDYIAGELNYFFCKRCKSRTNINEPILFINKLNKEIIVFFYVENIDAFVADIKNEIILDLDKIEEYKIYGLNTYMDTASKLASWCINPLQDFFSTYLSEKYYNKSALQKSMVINKIILNYFSLVKSNFLTIQLSSNKMTPTELFFEVLSNKIDLIYKNSVHERNISIFYDSLIKEIPIRCFSKDFFNYVLKGYENLEKEREDEGLNDIFKKEFIISCLSNLCKVRSGREQIISAIIISFWHIKERDNIQINDNYLLNSNLASKLLTFESLWNAIISLPNEEFEYKLRLAEKIFKYYGFEDKYNDFLKTGNVLKVNLSDIKIDVFYDELIKSSLSESLMETNNYEENVKLGFTLSHIVKNAYDSTKNIDSAFDLQQKLLYSEKIKSDIAKFVLNYNTIKLLNNLQEYSKSKNLLLSSSQFPTGLQPYEIISYFIEEGNTHRYFGKKNEALTSYENAERQISSLTDEERIKESKLVLKRNKLIIYRDLGMFSDAISEFEKLLESNEDNAEILHNIAVTYIQINNYEKGINYLIRALNTISELDNRNYCNYSVSLGLAFFKNGQQKESINCVVSAFEKLEDKSSNILLRLAFVGLSNFPKIIESEFTEIRNEIIKILKSEILENKSGHLHLRYTATIIYGIFLIRCEEFNKAEELLTDLRNNYGKIDNWKYYYLSAWVNMQKLEYHNAWIDIKESINYFKKVLPNQKVTDFLQDIDTEEYQIKISEWTFNLFKQNVVTEFDLIDVFEFINGYEISYKLSLKFDFETEINYDALYHNVEYKDIDFFFFYDNAKTTHLLYYNAYERKAVVEPDISFDIEEVSKIRSKLQRNFKNYIQPKVSERNFAFWNEFQKDLGGLISKYARSNSVCLFLGKTFSNIPLTLAKITDNEYLIERYNVVNGINLTSFILGGFFDEYSIANSTIINVPKENDDNKFRQNISSFINDITSNGANTFELLEGINATKNNILNAFESSQEVLFLCHGIDGNIAISNGEYLPPSDYFEGVLKDFFLSYQDFELLEKSPSLVVSAACSSASLKHGKGGVILGLGQGVWSKGINSLICPLWDIDQEAGFFWLKSFYSFLKDSKESVAIAHKKATLITKEKCEYPFYWSPFVLFGNIKTLKK